MYQKQLKRYQLLMKKEDEERKLRMIQRRVVVKQRKRRSVFVSLSLPLLSSFLSLFFSLSLSLSLPRPPISPQPNPDRTPGTNKPKKPRKETKEEKERKRARSAKRAAGLEGGLTPMELFTECFGGYPPSSAATSDEELQPATAVDEDFSITPSFRDSVKQAISHFYRGGRRAKRRARSAMSAGGRFGSSTAAGATGGEQRAYGYGFGPHADGSVTARETVYRPTSARRRPRRPQSSVGRRVVRIRQRPASAFSRREMFRILQRSPRGGGGKQGGGRGASVGVSKAKERPATSTGLKKEAPTKLRIEVRSPAGATSRGKGGNKGKKKKNRKKKEGVVMAGEEELQQVSDDFSALLKREFGRWVQRA